MASSSAGLHEDPAALKQQTIDRHRAIVSIMEELEAVDWYDQRVDAATDDELRAVLAHNRDEEKEHAAMALEWLRRRDPALDAHLRTYLFTDRPLLAIEEAVDAAEADQGEPARPGGGEGGAQGSDGSLGIGSLRREVQP
jgi:ferritin-like protein